MRELTTSPTGLIISEIWRKLFEKQNDKILQLSGKIFYGLH